MSGHEQSLRRCFCVVLSDDDFSDGGLNRESYARPGKLFTASANLFVAMLGQLHSEKRAVLVDSVVQLLRSGSH